MIRESSDYKISECRNILEDVDPYKTELKFTSIMTF